MSLGLGLGLGLGGLVFGALGSHLTLTLALNSWEVAP